MCRVLPALEAPHSPPPQSRGPQLRSAKTLCGHSRVGGIPQLTFAAMQQHPVALSKGAVGIAGGVPRTGNARDLQNTAAAQLVQHQGGIKAVRHLGAVGLNAPHKVQLCPAGRQAGDFVGFGVHWQEAAARARLSNGRPADL